MDLLERLRILLRYSGCSLRAFAIKCGISQPTLDKQIKGLRGISIDTTLSVLNAFPDVSAEWLLRGKGDMINSVVTIDDNEKILKLVDTITTLQDDLNARAETINALN